ncbi:DsbA family protein [Colwellia sp. 1_MG-2023]|uniref:DsbA family protein n=1 Tax=Colwellia sp. 1_MG-2023 TaxID=3062649 RepID=UPI0026E208A9|nr:DsbA family protein [Colwellia sp. 1_MG-2023]MDO6444810.1 DsbA family protein [Colwellia sp. 1_MG-2023]
MESFKKGNIITAKLLTKLKAAWLRSKYRAYFLTLKYLYWPSLFADKPTIEVYLALNDPHSFMLVQVLSEIEQRFKVNLKLFLIYETVPTVGVDPKIIRHWALADANYIAQQYGLELIKQYPSAKALITGQQIWQLSSKTVEQAATIFKQTWFDTFDFYYNPSTPLINFQIKNQQRLFSKGHYLPATLLFAGDWYIGIDRLIHLETKLINLGLSKSNELSKYNANLLTDKCVSNEDFIAPCRENQSENNVCEVFISLRSPYSYLGFEKVKALAKKYHTSLRIKPILPMVMRGLGMPINKARYIYIDAYREAKLANIPFQTFNDPIGQGIVNCYEIFSYAESKGKAVEFISAAFEAIYVKNYDVSQHQMMKLICQSINLDYSKAKEYAMQHDWQQWTDVNQTELEELGFWGVPCFKYQDTSCWGQDRLAQIEHAMKENMNKAVFEK